MIYKILISRSLQTPNSYKNWQTSCPLQTSVCNISRHLEFIIDQGHRVNWVSGSLDSRVTGSLGHKMWPSSMSGLNAVCVRCMSDVARVLRDRRRLQASARRQRQHTDQATQLRRPVPALLAPRHHRLHGKQLPVGARTHPRYDRRTGKLTTPWGRKKKPIFCCVPLF